MTATLEPTKTDLIVNGEWLAPSGGHTIEVPNPARPSEIVGYAASASRSDTARAIDAAHAAYPAWSALSFQERADYLRRLVANLESDVDERIRLFVREHGKIKREATLEMTRLGGRFEYTASLADQVSRDEVYPAPPFHSIVTKQPRGVAALIVPWNWPLSILGAKLPQALLAGNTVVVKLSPYAPLAPMQTLKLMADALPPGVLNVLTGSTEEVGGELLSNPLVRKVAFTGSVESGKQIMAAAASTLKDVTLELGGNDAGIILEDLDVSEEVIRNLVLGTYLSSGQICMALKRLYVHESVFDRLVDGLNDALSKYVVGDGLDERTTMGPINNRPQFERVKGLIADARQRGARIDELGEKLDESEFAAGFFQLPTLVTKVDASARVVAEEQFGPVLPIIPFKSEEEAVALANDSNFGLCSSVWSADVEHAVALARKLEAGYTYINNHGPLAQDNRAPFGGVKDSGIGRELGIEGVLEFLDYHSITLPA